MRRMSIKRVVTVFQRDFKELRKTSAFLIICIIFAAVTIAASTIITIILKKQELRGYLPAKPILELIVGLVAYFIPLSVMITFIWSFANLTIIREKADGSIQSLLATPLSPIELWLAKSMAIFFPAYIISVISSLIILLSINFFAIIPAINISILPLPSILISFFINPLLFMALIAFTVLFSIANNPDIAIAPSFLIGFGLMMGIPLGIATGIINITSWSFAIWCLVAAIIFWIIDIILLRMLTKENIVRSAGDV